MSQDQIEKFEKFEKACKDGNLEIINNMILSGFVPSSEQIYNILTDLVEFDKIEAVKILVPKVDISKNYYNDIYDDIPFHHVRSVEMAKIMIENDSAKFFNYWGLHPLPFLPVENDSDRELFKYLIENCKAENGITFYLDYVSTGVGYICPLRESYRKNDLDMTEFLLKNGFKDSYNMGSTIFQDACKSNNKEMMDLYIKYGQNIDTYPSFHSLTKMQ